MTKLTNLPAILDLHIAASQVAIRGGFHSQLIDIGAAPPPPSAPPPPTTP